MEGSICLTIADDVLNSEEIKNILKLEPSKFIEKNHNGNKRIKKSVWIYKMKFTDNDSLKGTLDRFIMIFSEKQELIKILQKKYKEIYIKVYLRSDYGQIGYTLKKDFLKKLVLLDMDIDFDILSFGLVEN